ncbi:FAD-binding oxidoreductase [Pseudomonas sp. CDFA 602]|uniref:FAD-binding oxidoreductase n=1 Tax=Pseudomonas californiensis TaxID=2829823 RepID=UPI001E3D5F96|nr:FAD-binding protein [Pseudomonas californiensis]MCD5994261.1 FAD-binding oxidoreductase [Pseudomonas californiensis]MCD5999640.1 FAD-binding oxidoreductase [Pseudomonas californiensis]
MLPSLLDDLELHLAGKYQLGDSAEQHLHRGLWNGSARASTAVLVECASCEDVQAAVRIAKAAELKVSVLGGGHDWVGRAISPNGMTLDLRKMNSVEAGTEPNRLNVGGGALVKDALGGLPSGSAFVAGVHTKVGVAGLALGGGYGKLNYRYGLAADALREAEVVLADGSKVIASQQHHADLFWALRGAGKNFGVVTAMQFEIFPVVKVLSGVFFVPLECARAALHEVQKILDEAGSDLSIFSSITDVPESGFGLLLELLWADDEERGASYSMRIEKLPEVKVIKKAWMEYKQIFDESGDALWPPGRGYRMDAYNISRLETEVINAIIQLARDAPSPRYCIMLHDFHGLAADVDVHATAFPLRRNHYNMQIVASWDPEDADAAEQGHEWIMKARQQIKPSSVYGGYPAVLDLECAPRARLFYRDNLDRLKVIKNTYDPGNMFAAAYGIFSTV